MAGWISLIILFGTSTLVNSILINTDVERLLDISSQLVKEQIKIVAEDDQPFLDYKIVLSEQERIRLAYISAQDGNEKNLNITEHVIGDKSWFTIYFNTASSTQILNIHKVFSNLIVPYPREIRQNEKQLVKFTGHVYLFSSYITKVQKLTVKLNSNVVSYSQIKPFSEVSNKIKYGPFGKTQAFSNQTFYVHYENHSPFMEVTNLERTLEVSHWGNIAVKESIQLRHTGALLKGSFSRYDFQNNVRAGFSAIKMYKTILPASATEVYYRDTNGNISTSNMNVLRDSVELELRPRFPLFGGWKSFYILGYNVPTYEYLFNNEDTYVLNIRLIDHIFDDMLVNKAVIRVVLPEGSSNIQLTAPYSVMRRADELLFTYLDTIGRPVIVFSKENLVENHISNFQLKYTFSKISLMHEPLLVIAFIFAIFVVCIICLRLNCSISRHHHKE